MKEEYLIQIDYLADLLEEYRTDKKISVRELSRLVGCSINTIQKVRHRNKNITPNVVKKICELIKVPLTSIVVSEYSTSHRPIPWNVPFRLNPNFIGRSNDMKLLRKMLQQDSEVVISQVNKISGMGGVGKTQLAVEYVHKYKLDYPGGILWIRGCENILSEYGALAEVLGLDLPMNLQESEKCRQVQWSLQRKVEKTLIVIDNLDNDQDYNTVHQYLPTTGNCQILITTRLKGLMDGKNLSLDILPDDKALELLLTESGRDSESKAAQRICRILGNLPLAIEIAGKYLKRMSIISFEGYHNKLLETGLCHPAFDTDEILRNVNHTANLKASLIIHQNLMDNPKIKKILAALTCFEPDSINPEILSMVCGFDWKKNKEQIWELIVTLENYSLIHILKDNRLNIHRLMQTTLKEQIQQKVINKIQRDYVIRLDKWLEKTLDVTKIKVVAPEISHLHKAAKIALEYNIWPQSYNLCISLGEYYGFIGHYQKKLNWMEKSETELKEKAPDDQAKLASTLANIGISWRFLGKYDKAIEFFEKALDIEREVYGEKKPQVADSLVNLGEVHSVLGKYDQSISYYEKALNIYRKHAGEESPNVAICLNNLGGSWYYLGKFKKAIDYCEQALDIDKKYYGERHPSVAERLSNLGLAWNYLKEFQKAINCLEQAISINKEVFGEQHPNVAKDLNNLGEAWISLGEFKKAISYLEKAISIDKEVFGEQHPNVASDLNNLGKAWLSLGELQKAISYLEKAISIDKEIFGDRHPNVAKDLYNLGIALKYMEKTGKAEECFKGAYSIFLEFLGEKHPHTQITKENLEELISQDSQRK